MIKNKIIDKWDKNEPVINGWLSIPNSFTAEAMSKMGWDSITIDLQHGQNDYQTSIAMIQAISNSSAIPFARVPWNEPGIIMKMLDIGALGIISPMINNEEDCKRFVSYCYYPPLGQRSFGPMRALIQYGPDYINQANKNIATFAMIETEEAINNIDNILNVPNLTGVYIGPADMSLSYGKKPMFDIKDDPIYSNIKLIVNKTKQYNKVAGIHNGTPEYAKEMINLGYNFVSVSSDYRSMTSHAQEILNKMKNLDKNEEEKTY